MISNGLSSRLLIMEETITEVNLIELATKHKDYIFTKKFTRREEGARSGADWLWLIGEPGSWLPLLIQAKIVNPKTGTCHYLNYNKGKQRSLLLQYSRRHSFLPYYCIYSLIPDKYVPKNKTMGQLESLNSEEWACTFHSPQSIREKIQRDEDNGEKLVDEGIPWTFPFCKASELNSGSLAKDVANSLSEFRSEMAKTLNGPMVIQSEDERKTLNWEDRDPSEMIMNKIPKFILRFLQDKTKSNDSPVSSMSIISSVPVQTVLSVYNALPSHQEEIFINPSFRSKKSKNNDG